MFSKKSFLTEHEKVTDLTPMVKEVVEESGVQEGICVVSIPHTTGGLVVTSFWDPLGWEDLMDELRKLVPARVDFKHQESPTDASGHIKSSLVGTSMSQIIHEGKLMLGSSQGIYFLEFDGPRQRQCVIKILEG